MAEMERVPRGEIVVGANEGTCLHILPEVFAEFKKLYPGVGVQISRLERAKIMESINDNSVDFGVVSTPVSDKRLTVVNIHCDELVIIAAPDHPLGQMKQATVAEVGEFPLLLPKAGRTRDALENLLMSAASSRVLPWSWIPASCSSALSPQVSVWVLLPDPT